MFKRNSNYDNDEDKSAEDSPPQGPYLSSFASKGEGYSFKRSENFSKSEKFHTKRNSSPLDENARTSLLKTSTKGGLMRTTSKSSSSSDFER